MRLAFVRTKTESTVFVRGNPVAPMLDCGSLEAMKISAKAGSSSKNIIFGLQRRNLVMACEEWKFWNGALQEISLPGQLPVKLFPVNEDLKSNELAQYIERNEPPDLIWVEGPDYPPYLEQIFDLCPGSFKLVYSKDWRPEKIKKLQRYDLCLVDEDWEVEEVKRACPDVACAVWDKLIDYENTHYPLRLEKIYDICYVAYLRPRKNHEFLFRALAKLPERRLNCVCVGDDRKGNRAELENLACELHLASHFTGEVSKAEVNRYINQSKIGVMCATLDAAPRAILEYMAADVPVLVNAELWAGSRYVGPSAGLVKSPEEFHLGIAALLDNYESYSPRAYLLEHYSFDKVMAKFTAILQEARQKRSASFRKFVV
jgi:glycosyltransferase involved in cell wall biosynthesis